MEMGILVFLPRKLSKHCCALTLMRTRTRCTTREWALQSKRRRSSRTGRDAWDPHTLVSFSCPSGTVFCGNVFLGTHRRAQKAGRVKSADSSLRCWRGKNQHRLWCGCVTCMHDWRVFCYKCFDRFLGLFMM